MKFKIKKRTFSWRNIWKYFNTTKANSIGFSGTLSPVRYRVNPSTDQGDWLKVVGLSENLFTNHKNSLMLVHRFINNKLELALYCHNNNSNPAMGDKNIWYEIIQVIPPREFPNNKYSIKGDLIIEDNYYKLLLYDKTKTYKRLIERTKTTQGTNRVIYPWAGGTGDVIQDLNYDIDIWKK